MVYLSYARAPTEEDILFRNVGTDGTFSSLLHVELAEFPVR
jgi:hypothetical protein